MGGEGVPGTTGLWHKPRRHSKEPTQEAGSNFLFLFMVLWFIVSIFYRNVALSIMTKELKVQTGLDRRSLCTPGCPQHPYEEKGSVRSSSRLTALAPTSPTPLCFPEVLFHA